jgi:hypothetical protein
MKIDQMTIRPSYELTALQTQTLMDFEIVCARLGLLLFMQCAKCYPRTRIDGELVQGDSKHDGTTYMFTVECSCSKHVYRGSDLIFPPPPHFTPLEKEPDGEKRLRTLTREEMGAFKEADDLFRVLKMRHWFRCIQCQHQGQPTDGVWGAGDSTSGEFIVECACTKRVYVGSDAAAPVH